MENIEVKATLEGFEQAENVLEEFSRKTGCPSKSWMKFRVAFEELFINIVHYAYPDSDGRVEIWYCLQEVRQEKALQVTVQDAGSPYNPLANEMPELDEDIRERPIGGLGIFLAKNMVDELSYFRKDGKNCLVILKKF